MVVLIFGHIDFGHSDFSLELSAEQLPFFIEFDAVGTVRFIKINQERLPRLSKGLPVLVC